MASSDLTKQGTVSAVDEGKKTFALVGGPETYKINKNTPWPPFLRKGAEVRFLHGVSDFKGKTYHWANNVEYLDGASGEPGDDVPAWSNDDDPRDETPPVGRYESKSDMDRTGFNIMWGMCLNNVVALTAANIIAGRDDGTTWDSVLMETEAVYRKAMKAREALWERERG